MIHARDSNKRHCEQRKARELDGRVRPEALARPAAERQRDPVLDARSLVIGISQSGETIDTLAAVRYAKAQGANLIGVSNVLDSALARAHARSGDPVAIAAYLGGKSGPGPEVTDRRGATSRAFLLAARGDARGALSAMRRGGTWGLGPRVRGTGRGAALRGGRIPTGKALAFWTVATAGVGVTAWAATDVPSGVTQREIVTRNWPSFLRGNPIWTVFLPKVGSPTIVARPRS